MKNFSAPLLAFLAANPAYNRADLFAITCGAPQNLLSYSQDFSQAAWTKTTGVSVIANASADPTGLMTASQISYNGSGTVGNFRIFQGNYMPAVGVPYTVSVWLRAAAPVTVALSSNISGPQNINLTTSWQRFSITSIGNGASNGQLVIYSPAGVNTAFTIFAWGAQLELTPVIGLYVATGGSAQGGLGPRPTIYATSSQVDLVYAGVTFYSSKNGAWQRGKITSEASFGLHSNSMSLTVLSPASLLFLSSGINYMAAALAGLFDAALVQVFTAYWPLNAQPNPSIAALGLETKFVGYILPDGQISRSKIEFSVADGLMALNLKTPPNVIQASCRHTLYNANCTLDRNNFASTNSVSTGSTTQSINTGSTLPHAAPYYSQGFLIFTSGFNNGLTYSIKAQLSTSNILLSSKTLLPITLGDTFTIYAGCDKTPATCQSRFNNLIHIGATPFVPNPEVAI